MKKTLTALVCMAALTLALAGCGEGGGKSDPPELTADTDFEALVSEELTEAQWDAAFTDEAFAGVTMKFSQKDNTRIVKYGYEKNGDDFSILKDARDLTRGSGQCSLYCFKADEVNVYLNFAGQDKPQHCVEGVWYTQKAEKGSKEWDSVHSETSMQWGNSFRGMVAYDFAGKFGEFTYDETQHAYTFTGEMFLKYMPMEAMGGGYTVSAATLKFVDGKLAYAKVNSSAAGQNAYSEEVYTYYDYGKTKIVIPTDAQPMPE